MNALTFEETNLLCIYGTRQGAIEALTEMRGHLQADETELLALTDSTLAKLRAMTDAEFDELELPTKAEQYAQMADQVARQLTGSWQEWAGFLTTAARLYKYPFHEQLMIYAQRPDATACAEYDLWNDRMGRYVRRGSKGIALVDDSGDRPRLRYVFDISDTGTREHSRTPWLWTMNEEHTAPVMAMLERNYDVGGGVLAQQLADVAAGLAEEYWTDHRQDILYIVDGSFLCQHHLRPDVPLRAGAGAVFQP